MAPVPKRILFINTCGEWFFTACVVFSHNDQEHAHCDQKALQNVINIMLTRCLCPVGSVPHISPHFPQAVPGVTSEPLNRNGSTPWHCLHK
jgi:hypothetical protein